MQPHPRHRRPGPPTGGRRGRCRGCRAVLRLRELLRAGDEARPRVVAGDEPRSRAGRCDQVGSVTTTPERAKHVFDWDQVQLPWGALVATMADLHMLGPIGFRGPAAAQHPGPSDGDRRGRPHGAADLAGRRVPVERARRRDPRPDRRGDPVHHLGQHVEPRLQADRGRALRDARDPAGVRAPRRRDADRAPQRAREPAPLPAPPAVLDLDRRLPPGPPGARAARLARRAR